MSTPKYWLVLTDEQTWPTVKEHGVYGFAEKNRNYLSRLSVADKAIVYVKGNRLAACFEISDLHPASRVTFPTQDYPYQLRMSMTKEAVGHVRIPPNVRQEISIFKNLGSKWGAALIGKPLRELSQQEFSLIESLL